jgi:hypothetical protein
MTTAVRGRRDPGVDQIRLAFADHPRHVILVVVARALAGDFLVGVDTDLAAVLDRAAVELEEGLLVKRLATVSATMHCENALAVHQCPKLVHRLVDILGAEIERRCLGNVVPLGEHGGEILPVHVDEGNEKDPGFL